MRQIDEFEKQYVKEQTISFAPGDTIAVHQTIEEGDKTRIQVFQGVVMGRRGSGTGATFTVRKISAGIAVEKVFPLNSPNIAKIERVREGKIHRAKLNYLRDRAGKSARIDEKKKELL